VTQLAIFVKPDPASAISVHSILMSDEFRQAYHGALNLADNTPAAQQSAARSVIDVNFHLEEKSLLSELLLQSARELPARWFAPPTSRAFAARLSNLDIWATVCGLPPATSRFWRIWWLDALRASGVDAV
jgi:hypothetical protein